MSYYRGNAFAPLFHHPPLSLNWLCLHSVIAFYRYPLFRPA